MWRLLRQWRYVRWVNNELLRHEEEQGLTAYGSAMLLAIPSAISEYRARFWVWASEVQIKQLLQLCVDEGYLVEQDHAKNGPSVKVSPSKGDGFRPLFSGLFLGELALLGPLWSFLAGGGLVLLLWLLHEVGTI